jgi:hypothetical protein
MANRDIFWTNPSVLQFAGESDPIDLIAKRARDEILRAIQAGWQGPPFDPFWLAEHFEIPVIPREDVLELPEPPEHSLNCQWCGYLIKLGNDTT